MHHNQRDASPTAKAVYHLFPNKTIQNLRHLYNMNDKAEKIQSKVEERERNETEITVRQQRRGLWWVRGMGSWRKNS